ncbi:MULTISPECIES: GNAT family N-acetyltransferase [unclassified Streptomyces]|uniref:GNAT family N-acetyltransferase n=1 Tax=unclassified Streptomyces TaxID=2593676 RepID=UPI0010C10DEC|nr:MULTISPECIES: GNAT family N-acetyltransferase [unclassified Streptomyces]MBV7243221.1 GNAT family N-acetyltransferase [Streptomyces sp. MW-W600-10]
MSHSATPPHPPGTTVRDMRIDDCEAVATVRVRGWQHAYRGLLPQPYLDRMDIAEETGLRRRYFEERGETVNVVAELPDGTVTGWACVGPHRAEDHGRPGCELYAIYVLPEHIGTGTGRALLAELTARAAAAGHPDMALWVLRDNGPARRFYERAGFRPDGAEDTFTAGGALVTEVRYVRPLTPPAAG